MEKREADQDMPIYVIMLTEKLGLVDGYYPDLGETRTMGFQYSHEEAVRCVKDYYCNLGVFYPYCIIEMVFPDDYYHKTGGRWFYHFNNRGAYVPIVAPKGYENFIDFTMG